MLDQNTDRMWFVIGAVIVGAAIIFIANGTLPTLFASVADSFEDAADKGTEVVDEIGANPNLLLGTTSEWTLHETSLHVASAGPSSQYRDVADTGLKAGETVTLSGEYDFGEYSYAPRINFSPVPYDTDDEREMSRVGSAVTGTGKFTYTVVVPETTQYYRVMMHNLNGSDRANWPEHIKIRKLKLERGEKATMWMP